MGLPAPLPLCPPSMIPSERAVFLNDCSAGALDAIASRLSRGADPNARDPEGRSALLLACLASKPKAALLLLKAGADPFVPAQYTLLHLVADPDRWAPEPEHLTLALALLAQGADPNERDRFGESPFHIACRACAASAHPNSHALFEALLAAGGDPSSRSGLTPAELAAQTPGSPLAERLRALELSRAERAALAAACAPVSGAPEGSKRV